MNNFYKNEARERWGDTAAYREHAEKTKHYTKEKWDTVNNGLMSIFAEFSKTFVKVKKMKGDGLRKRYFFRLCMNLNSHKMIYRLHDMIYSVAV